jgi:hypothetical protein
MVPLDLNQQKLYVLDKGNLVPYAQVKGIAKGMVSVFDDQKYRYETLYNQIKSMFNDSSREATNVSQKISDYIKFNATSKTNNSMNNGKNNGNQNNNSMNNGKMNM